MMARPRKNRAPGSFTTSELATATGLTQRQVIYLREQHGLPSKDEAGKAAAGIYCERVLLCLAATGALIKSGLSLGSAYEIAETSMVHLPLESVAEAFRRAAAAPKEHDCAEHLVALPGADRGVSIALNITKLAREAIIALNHAAASESSK